MRIGIIIFLLLSFVAVNAQKKANQIVWSKEQRLTWEDFKGRPKSTSTAGALTMSGGCRCFSYKNGKIIMNTESIFFTKQSWGKDFDKIPSTLEHEQLHFDITELHSRKFRELLLETKFKKNSEKAYKQFYIISDKIDVDKDAYQDLYDKETTNPRDEVKQKEWLKKVAQELLELEEYANPEIIIDLNKKCGK